MPYLRRSRTKRASLGLRRICALLTTALAALSLPAGALPGADDNLPTISYSIDGIAGTNGWYSGSTHGNSIVLHWSVSPDATSTDCQPAIQIPGPNTGITKSCSASNAAGEVTATTKVIKIDADPPTAVAASAGRAPDSNGWYNHPVALTWGGTDATSGIAACTSLTYSGPDSGSAMVTGVCTDNAGNTASSAFRLDYDATGPTVSASADRPSDYAGWYNHPVKVQFAGTDSVSGIDSCTSTTYSGPDSGAATVAGSCRDRAGNASSGSFALEYDATPPTLTGVSVKSGDRADVLRWKSSSPTDTVQIRRAPRGRRAEAQQTVFRGTGPSFTDRGIQDSLEYVYSVQTYDQAGNASKTISRLALPKVLTLRKTPYVPRAAAEPILRWPAVPTATYYHVQLFRGSTRILAAWPRRPELGLRASWRWAGHVYRLAPGRYRWYAWAGLGRRSAAHYRLLGKAEFIVPST